MHVINVNGTSQNRCRCGSWLDHWKRFSGSSLPMYCSETSCRKKPTTGAHVQSDGPVNGDWYIVPLCDDHNRRTGKTLELVAGTILVRANVHQTCEKRAVA